MKNLGLHTTKEDVNAYNLSVTAGPQGFMPYWAIMTLGWAWIVTAFTGLGAVVRWMFAFGDWPHLAVWCAPRLVLTAVWAVVFVWGKAKTTAQSAAKEFVQAQRDKDERLGIAGELCDALRLRLFQDVEARERVCRVEARLWCLVEDETRVALSMKDRPAGQLEAESRAKTALTAEIDRIMAGISTLHAAVFSPSREASALEWLEAEVELAQPARPRRLQSSSTVLTTV